MPLRLSAANAGALQRNAATAKPRPVTPNHGETRLSFHVDSNTAIAPSCIRKKTMAGTVRKIMTVLLRLASIAT